MQCRACRAESKETPAFIHLLFLHEKEMNHHSGVPSLLQAFFRPSMRHERTELNKAVEPHSLSYQDTSLTKLLFSEIPALMSTTEEVFSPTKSVETTSSSTYPRMPFIGPSASALIVATMSSIEAPFSIRAVRSTTETSGVGTRKAMPVSLPFNSGMTLPTAFAAPVAEGMMFAEAHRPPRQSPM